jgi:hypothetical protein
MTSCVSLDNVEIALYPPTATLSDTEYKTTCNHAERAVLQACIGPTSTFKVAWKLFQSARLNLLCTSIGVSLNQHSPHVILRVASPGPVEGLPPGIFRPLCSFETILTDLLRLVPHRPFLTYTAAGTGIEVGA